MMRAFFDDPFFGPPRVQQGQVPQAHPGGQQQPYAGGGQVGPGQCAARVLGLAGWRGAEGVQHSLCNLSLSLLPVPTPRRPPLLPLQGRTIHIEGDNYPSAPPRPGFPQQHAWGAGGGWGPQAPTGEEAPIVPHRTTGPIIDELEDGSHHHVVDFGSSQPDTVEEPEEYEEGGEAWEGPGRAGVKRKRPRRTLAGYVEHVRSAQQPGAWCCRGGGGCVE